MPFDPTGAVPDTPFDPTGAVPDVPTPAQPQAVPFRPPTQAEHETTGLLRSVMMQTTAGRVMDAFGHGFSDGWGEGSPGADAKSALRKVGWISGPNSKNDWQTPVRALNESVLMPLAAGFDAALRGGNAIMEGGAAAAGEAIAGVGEGPVAQWTPEQKQTVQNRSGRIGRDMYMAAQTLGVLSADGPVAGKGQLRDVRPVERPEPPVLKPAEPPPIPDTRGQGTFYHGTSSPIKNLYDYYGSDKSIYGTGLYTTDAYDVAQGYSKKGRGGNPTIYQVQKTGQEKFLDMDAPLTPEIDKLISGQAKHSELVQMSLEDEEGKPSPVSSMRQLYDRMRGNSRDLMMSTTDVQEEFDAIASNLEAQGYTGLQHVGGGNTKTPAHTVQIHWKPNETGVSVAQIHAPPPPGPSPTDTFAMHAAEKTRYMASDEGLRPDEKSAPLPETSTIDKAGNINLDRINSGEDVKQVIRDTADQNGGFTDARRGTISLAQTEDMAHALGITPENFINRDIGKAYNAEEAVATRNALVQSATEVRDQAVKAAGGTDQDLLEFQRLMTRHQAIQEHVASMTAEAGRALSSFRIKATDADVVKQIFEQYGGRESVDDLARRIGALDTPEKVSKFLMDTKKPTFKDMAVEYFVNNLLSGPATHMSYTESNVAFALWKNLVETPIGATLGAVKHVVNPKADRVVYSEVGAGLHGLYSGAPEGIRAGWQALKENRTGALPGEAVSPAFVGKKAIPGMAGEVIRFPSRVIAGLHTFNRVMGYRQQLAMQAARQAAREGLKDEQFTTRIAQLKADPTEEMMTLARKEATSQTLMDKPGMMGKDIEKWTNQPGIKGLALKIIFPFVRIATNIVQKGLVERTPLAFASKEFRDNMLGKNGDAAQQMQAARMLAGTGVLAGVWSLAGQGLVTGGGTSDSKQAAVMRATGWQPYSVRIGGWYYGYHRLGPLGVLIGAAADLHDVWHLADQQGLEKASVALLQATMRGVLNETWMRGLSDLNKAATDPERYGGSYASNLAADFVPFSVGMGQTARSMDPDLREAHGLIDTIKSRIPGLSQTLLPRRDIWGEPIPNQGSLGPDILSAIYTSKANNDPIDRELLRLGKYPAPMQGKIAGAKLTPEQLDTYRMYRGRLLRLGFQQVINGPGYAELPDHVQFDTLQEAQKTASKQARALMQMKYPKLVTDGVQQRAREILGAKKQLDPAFAP